MYKCDSGASFFCVSSTVQKWVYTVKGADIKCYQITMGTCTVAI